jgi:hypothetical protein
MKNLHFVFNQSHWLHDWICNPVLNVSKQLQAKYS